MLCAAIVFALPGMPCVYYGDEEGMQGLRDPFCRGSYVQQEDDTRAWYSYLGNLRRDNSALATGDVAIAAPEDDIICILRFDRSGSFLCCVNRGEQGKAVHLRAEDFSGADSKTVSGKFDTTELYLEPCKAMMVKVK